MSSEPPRLLIAMIEAGGGHKAPAMAVRDALRERYGDALEIDVLDFMLEVGDASLDRRHKASWRWMLEHPRITRSLQRWLDERIPVALSRAVQGAALHGHSKRAAAFVRGRRYDAALCTHFMPLQALAMANASGRITLPLFGFGSDPFDGHALWAEPRVDTLFVASERAAAKFAANGVPRSRLDVTGYPLRRMFREAPPDRPDARAAFGLDRERFTVVQSAGSEGIDGALEAQVRAVLATDLPLQLVVVCGRNEGLRERLVHLADARLATEGDEAGPRLVPLGFIDRMPMLLAAADLVLAKAGAASTLEPLALGRPVFHTSYVAGNEWANVAFCLERGIGAWLPTPEAVVEALRHAVSDPEAHRALEARVAALELPDGAARMADRLASVLGVAPVAESHR